jgi:SAM-dependent methyltransferase
MGEDSWKQWFVDLKERLESAYLESDEPWKQSGFSGPEERWVDCRRPIADCVETSGTFLDIGCANGYLLECLMRWTAENEISIVPYGLDLSERLAALARKRLPDFATNIYLGNGLTWKPALRFDYVRTELCYVPAELAKRYVEHILKDLLMEKGRLLVAEYRSRRDEGERAWVDELLGRMGLVVQNYRSGVWDGKELARIATVKNPAGS